MEEVLTLRRQVWIKDGTEKLIMGVLSHHRGTYTEHLAVRGRQVRHMWTSITGPCLSQCSVGKNENAPYAYRRICSGSLVSTRRPFLISALSSGEMEDWDQNGGRSALAHEGMKIVPYLEEEEEDEEDVAEAERGQERKKVTVSNVPKGNPDVADWLQMSESVIPVNMINAPVRNGVQEASVGEIRTVGQNRAMIPTWPFHNLEHDQSHTEGPSC